MSEHPTHTSCLIFHLCTPLTFSAASIQRRQRTTTFYADLIGNIDTLSRCVRGDIDKDVDRTFPEHAYFDQGDTLSQNNNVTKPPCLIHITPPLPLMSIKAWKMVFAEYYAHLHCTIPPLDTANHLILLRG